MRILKKENQIKKDIEILSKFFIIYCNNFHLDKAKSRVEAIGILNGYVSGGIILCNECRRHFVYSSVKRIICPLNPKPACKKCPQICYSKEHRKFMRSMMRFSGMYMIKHGRLDLILKYFF